MRVNGKPVKSQQARWESKPNPPSGPTKFVVTAAVEVDGVRSAKEAWEKAGLRRKDGDAIPFSAVRCRPGTLDATHERVVIIQDMYDVLREDPTLTSSLGLETFRALALRFKELEER